MCERYVLPHQSIAEHEFLPAQAWWKFAPKFNVGPTQYVPSVRMHQGRSEGVMMRWGLIPAWAEGVPTKNANASAPIETVVSSPLYRMPWLAGQRCILPVAGFFTWRLTPGRYRQPYYVHLSERSVFGVAAVWDQSVDDADDVIESCSLVSVPPNELMAGVSDSQQQMPAILRRRDYEIWLTGTPGQAKAVLYPYKGQWMQAHPVSPRVNSGVADDPALIVPAL